MRTVAFGGKVSSPDNATRGLDVDSGASSQMLCLTESPSTSYCSHATGHPPRARSRPADWTDAVVGASSRSTPPSPVVFQPRKRLPYLRVSSFSDPRAARAYASRAVPVERYAYTPASALTKPASGPE